MGLRLSPDKTLITHIDQGLDFLGWRIQRHRKRGSNRHYVYTSRRKRPYGPSPGRSRRCADRSARTNPWMPCSSGSTRWCGAGVATSGPGCPTRPLPISATTCGFGSGTGYAANTPGSPGRTSAAATSAADHGRPATVGYCSTPPRSTPAATATGAQPSRHPGRPPHRHRQAHLGLTESPLR